MTKRTCPECGGRDAVPIAYGMPGPEMRHRAERGELILGGCCITGDDPEWHCRQCDHEWPVAESDAGNVLSVVPDDLTHQPPNPEYRAAPRRVGSWQMLRNLFSYSGRLPGDGFDSHGD